MGTTADKLEYLDGTKSAIKQAIVGKGVAVPDGTTFRAYAEKIGSIVKVPSLSNPGSASDLRSGKQLAGADGSVITGTLAEVTQATPSISVSSGGLITASVTQSGGIVAAGSKSSTQQLTTQGAKTITPTTTNQTAVASGRYTTGDVVVSGDANLVPENIAEGVSIFGITGTHSGGGGSATVTLIGQYYGILETPNYGFLAVDPNGSVQKHYVNQGQTIVFEVMQNSFALPMYAGNFKDSEQIAGYAQIINDAKIYLDNTGTESRLVFIYGNCTITI